MAIGPFHNLALASISNNDDTLYFPWALRSGLLRPVLVLPGACKAQLPHPGGRNRPQQARGASCGVKAHLSSLKFELISPEHSTLSSSGLSSCWVLPALEPAWAVQLESRNPYTQRSLLMLLGVSGTHLGSNRASWGGVWPRGRHLASQSLGFCLCKIGRITPTWRRF